jgi:predicted acyltransferase (DUF342 family)
MTIIFAFTLLAVMFVSPFLPGIIEYYQKTDAAPLFVAADYSRRPRYFSDSFRRILTDSLIPLDMDNNQVMNVLLSKKEKIEMTTDRVIPAGQTINHLICVMGDLNSGNDVKFNSNIFAAGNVCLGKSNYVHVLAADGDVTIAEGLKLNRWVDAQETLDISENCDLGLSATSGSILRIDKNCRFRRLYGMPIIVGINQQLETVNRIQDFSAASNSPDNVLIRKRKKKMTENTEVVNNIVFEKSVKIGQGCIFRGAVKSYGNLDIKENVTIHGNVFADGDIRVGSGSVVRGNIFSQGSIFLAQGVRISRPKVLKSVIGKKAVNIEKGVIIYGYVATEGEGLTL